MRWVARPGGITWLLDAIGTYVGEVKKRPRGLRDQFVWSAIYGPVFCRPKDFVATDKHHSLEEAKKWLELIARLKGHQ